MTYPNKDTYDGEWNYGEKHGRGCFTFANGDKVISTWTVNVCNKIVSPKI